MDAILANQLDLTMFSFSPVSPLSPVSPMSPAKPSARPAHLLMLNQLSSSLSGMEIAVPSPLTPTPIFLDSRASRSKALPPIPGKSFAPHSPHSVPTSRSPSTTYFNHKEERPRTPRFALQDEALSSKSFLAPPETRSSASSVPDQIPLRPQLLRHAHTQVASEFPARKQPSASSVFTEWRAPKYEYSDKDEYSDDEDGPSLPASGKSSSQASRATSEYTQSAEERARDYALVLPAFDPEPFFAESSVLPSEMSARITDVFDGSLTPASLGLSGNYEDRKLSSQFSSSDSEVDSIYDGSKPSITSRARKVFHSRKASQERREKAQEDLKLLQRSQAGEIGTAKHASLQKGIDEMYSTLTGFYSPAKPKTKHDSAASSKSKAIAGDACRPATPAAADQKLGREVLASPKKDDSVGRKLANVFQNGAMAVGLDRGKEQKLKKEE